MSGLGFFQLHCLTISPFEISRKAFLKVRNGGRLKCKSRAELTVGEVPYVDEVVKRLSQNRDAFRKTQSVTEEAYQRCRIFCADREKVMFSGSRYLTEDRARAIWALVAWGRRIDDLVDSPKDNKIRSAYLDEWEERTKDILSGRPHDILDAALVDSISKFHLEITPFEDVMKGMRMDITKTRYANFEELFLYCYYVAGTIGLMVVPILGIAPESAVSSKIIYDGLVYTFIALQLTNILKDVSDDAQLGRVYLPQDELAQFELCDEHIFSKKVTRGWREFMKKQVQRARFYFKLGEQGVSQLDKSSRSKLLLAVSILMLSLNAIVLRYFVNTFRIF